MKQFLFIGFVLLAFTSCQKAFDCIRNSGDIVMYEYKVSEFDTLVIKSDFTVHLFQDTVNKIIVSAHEKIADAFVYEIENNRLNVDNNYRCKFTKPEKNNVDLYIHTNELSLIKVLSPSKIISENKLLNDDEIGLIVNTKFCEADLNVDSRVFYYWNTHLNGGKMIVRGNVEYLKLWNTSLFAVNASNLLSDKAYVENSSKADIYLNAGSYLNCTIAGSGNVYYKGDPKEIIVNDTLSSGKLIKIN